MENGGRFEGEQIDQLKRLGGWAAKLHVLHLYIKRIVEEDSDTYGAWIPGRFKCLKTNRLTFISTTRIEFKWRKDCASHTEAYHWKGVCQLRNTAIPFPLKVLRTAKERKKRLWRKPSAYNYQLLPPAQKVLTDLEALDLFKDEFEQNLSVDAAMKRAKVGNDLS